MYSNINLKKHAPLLLLLLIIIVIYIPALNVPFLGDEIPGLLHNKVTRSLSLFTANFNSLYAFFHRPISVVSYTLQFYLTGVDPLPFHVVNIIIHIINTVLIFIIAQKLNISGIISAAIFGLHPLATACATQIYGRNYSLGMLFILFAFAVVAPRLVNDSLRKNDFILLSIAIFLATLTKQVYIVYPVIFYFFIYFRSDIPLRLTGIRAIFAVSIVLLIFLYIYYYAIPYSQGNTVNSLTYLYSQFGNAWSVLVTLYLFPYKISLLHKHPWYYSISEPEVISGILLFLSLAMFILLNRKRLSSALLACLVLSLLPTNSVIAKYQVVIEWRLYPSLVFFSLFLGLIFTNLIRIKRTIVFAYLFLISFVFFNAFTVYNQNKIYQSQLTTYKQVLEHYPDSLIARNNIGAYYYTNKEYENAIKWFRDADKLSSCYIPAIANLIRVYNKLDSTAKVNFYSQKLSRCTQS